MKLRGIIAAGILAIISVLVLPVYAADAHNAHCICGDARCNGKKASHKQDTKGFVDIEKYTTLWQAWDGTTEIEYDHNRKAYIYLSKDVTLTESLYVGKDLDPYAPRKTLYLCLNGHKLTSSNNAEPIVDSYVANFVLCDCTENGYIGERKNAGMAAVLCRGMNANIERSVFYMFGGSIYKNATDGDGGGVSLSQYSDFYMHGGAIMYNSATGNGGAVYSCYESTINFYNGSISQNTSGGSGGAFYMYNYGDDSAALNVGGGSIQGNTAEADGGAIYIYNDDSTPVEVTLNGGGIVNNTSTKGKGGGIWLQNCNVSATGLSLVSNTASGDGGGIWLKDSKTDMKNITAANNKTTGGSGGGIFADNSALTISDNSIINENACTGKGGGIWVSGVTADISDCGIQGNSTSGNDGGGIYANACVITLKSGTKFVGNRAIYGAGLYLDNKAPGTMQEGVTMEGNSAQNSDQTKGSGGGVFVYSGSTFTMNGGLIQSNSARELGAGIHAASRGTIIINGGEIYSNKSYGKGGGVGAHENGKVTISGGKIFGNYAIDGAGVYLSNANLDMTGGTIRGNYAEGNGGGVWIGDEYHSYYKREAKAVIDGGEIYKNMTPKGNGGGIYINGEKSSLTARSGSISENVSILGGGIFVGNASFRLEGAVIMQNKATQNGGGVYNNGNMTVDGSGFIYSNYQTDEVSYDAKAGAPSNLYLPNGKIINIGNNGLKKAKIWVTTEGGKVNITSSHNIDYDCNKIFRTDDTKYAIDSESGIIKLVDGYAVTFDYADGSSETVSYPQNKPAAMPDDPQREQYSFAGWFIGGSGYDFAKPLTGNITLTAKWVADGEKAVSITPDRFYVIGLSGRVYIASCGADGLIDIYTGEVSETTSGFVSDIDLDTASAEKITIFAWDEGMTPICKKASTSL